MFFDRELAHLPPSAADRDLVPMLFADGHADTKRRSLAAAPVVNPFSGLAESLHDTPGGVRGWDY
jgi:prepilin-type processing-associated H-X9-DG protein